MLLRRNILRRGLGTFQMMSAGLLLPPRAPVPSILVENASTADAASIDTASFAITAGVPVYAAVVSRIVGTPNTPTATGHGLEWAQVQTAFYNTVNRLTVFVAHPRADSTGALTFDFGGQTQTSFVWAIAQCPDASRVPTRQSTTTSAGVAGTSANVALEATLGHARNAVLVWTAIGINGAIGNDADFAELSDRGIASNASSLELQWAPNQQDCTSTFSSSVSGMVAVEVRGAA